MKVLVRAFAALCLVALAACGKPVVLAPLAEVQARAYHHPGPPALTLYTVINNRSGSGAHTALMVSGSQRVLWDPAGSFKVPFVPERNDVLFGMTEQARKIYIDYHARETFRIVEQTVEVSPETAELALKLVQEQGNAGDATCSLTTSRILSKLPGFEGFPVSWFPVKTMEAFAARTGVQGRTITDDDADENHGVLIRATEAPPNTF
ncbi:hypothetical protein [Oceaniglobus roseus]|uniref:hypothetical protein n=1 Tax=Oceaniglobus roseus TaxID=1737570 RepID=UPI001FECE391|nr:hypothetical protein [Kandeliimicrobium roseum]